MGTPVFRWVRRCASRRAGSSACTRTRCGSCAPGSAAAEASALVVIEHARRFHERLDDGRPDEPEPALPQIRGERLRLTEPPRVGVEGAVLVLHFEERLRV